MTARRGFIGPGRGRHGPILPVDPPPAEPAVELRPPAREAVCCTAAKDTTGRLPIGWCGPDCIRRRTRSEGV